MTYSELCYWSKERSIGPVNNNNIIMHEVHNMTTPYTHTHIV